MPIWMWYFLVRPGLIIYVHHISAPEAGLTVKGRKCQFGMQQYTYLGHAVGMGCLRPEAGK